MLLSYWLGRSSLSVLHNTHASGVHTMEVVMRSMLCLLGAILFALPFAASSEELTSDARFPEIEIKREAEFTKWITLKSNPNLVLPGPALSLEEHLEFYANELVSDLGKATSFGDSSRSNLEL